MTNKQTDERTEILVCNIGFLILSVVPQDVDVNLDTKKVDWKKNRDNMIETIKEAKKTRPPSAKKDIEVQIVMKAGK